MKLTIKPNYKKFTFQQLIDFYNKYLGIDHRTYLIKADEDYAVLYKFEDGSKIDDISEYTLRMYFEDEVSGEDISCFEFFYEK